MTHKTLDPATARRVPQAAQGRMVSRPVIASAMCQMEAPDLGEQGAIGRPCAGFLVCRAKHNTLPQRRP